MTVLHEAQKVIARDPHRFRVVCSGRRFGKTVLAIDQMKARASIPNSRVAYISPTYQSSRDIVWEALKKDCLQASSQINEARLEIKLVNGSLIILRGWESIETMRGQAFDLLVLDEVAQFRDFWMSWQEVLRPTLTDTKGEGIFISTPKGFNHFYELYNKESGVGHESGPDDDFKSFHYTSYDNPFIPKEEIDKAQSQITADRFSQEYLADFTKTEGLVYKEFKRERHLIDPDSKEIKAKTWKSFMTAVDWGYTNPAAVLSVYRDAADNYYVMNEWYEKGRTDAEVAEYVAALHSNFCYPDPESAGGIMELKKRGVNVRPVIKGKDSIVRGISAVRDFFKADKIFISRKCKNLIMELETYSYSDDPTDELPEDENNHLLDGLRYIVMMTASSQPTVASQYRPNFSRATSRDKLMGMPQGTTRQASQYRPHYGKVRPKVV
jgi:PBSX family phage terminase large subunit